MFEKIIKLGDEGLSLEFIRDNFQKLMGFELIESGFDGLSWKVF